MQKNRKKSALSYKKWNVINKNKYPDNGIMNEYIFENTLPYQKIIGYIKNDMLCFYWGVGKIKFTPMDCKEIIFYLYSSAFNKIKEWIEKNNYNEKIGFELTEFEQLNKVVEYMIKRNGYSSIREDGFLIVNKTKNSQS